MTWQYGANSKERYQDLVSKVQELIASSEVGNNFSFSRIFVVVSDIQYARAQRPVAKEICVAGDLETVASKLKFVAV